MATAAPVSTTWIPEDDLLLKNAVEVTEVCCALVYAVVDVNFDLFIFCLFSVFG